MAKHAALESKKNQTRGLIAAILLAFVAPLAMPASSTTVTSVTPDTGFNGGGFTVEASGTDLVSSVSAVSLISNSFQVSASFTVVSATTISISVPSITLSDRVTGVVTLKVHLTDGSEVDLPFTLEPSEAQTLTPDSGSAAGGTIIQVSGKHFGPDISGSPQVVDVYLNSTTLSFQASMSFEVVSDTSISTSIPVITAASRSASVFDVVVVYVDGTQSTLNYTFSRPTITSVTPEIGSPGGGTAITISGTGFFDGGSSGAIAALRIGSEVISTYTVVSDTTITAELPSRSGINRTIGSKKFYLETAVSASGDVYFTFAPSRESAKDNATATGLRGQVVLGELASRSEGKPIVRSGTGSGPFFVDGTDGVTGLPYRYRTNAPYTHGNATNQSAYKNESKETADNIVSSYTAQPITETTLTISDRALSVFKLKQSSNCSSHDNGSGSTTAYCSIFGPEFYTEPFYATSDQALSFEWYAKGVADDYEIYAFLVAVPDETTIPTPAIGNHTLAAHGMGYYQSEASGYPQFWQTSTANVPADGLYRFRFVSGSYDGTGGKALGSEFYVGSVFSAGTRNAIQFGPISDQVGTGGSFAVTATADSQERVDVEVAPGSESVCSVTTSYAAPTTTVTITKNQVATCTLIASQNPTGEFATPANEVVSFRILASKTTASAPAITKITPDNGQLTVNFTRPAFDGGDPITNYAYSIDGGSNYTNFSPADTTSLQVVITGLNNGTTYDVRIRALTGQGDGAQSTTVQGTPVALSPPNIAYSPITQSMTVNSYGSIGRPTNTGGAVAGYTISSGVLPAGLSLNTSTGFIQGTPTATGSTTVYVEAFNSGGTSSPAVLTIEVIDLPPIITYANSSITITQNSAMTAITPTFSGGPLTDSSTVVTYSGTIPTGLALNATTGEISGTPTTANGSGVALQIRAIGLNGQLSGAFALTIVVSPIPAPNLAAYTVASYSLRVGTATTINPPTNSGGSVTTWSSTPVLPSGLTINGSTGVITGTPTTVATIALFTISARNSTGTSSATISIEVLPRIESSAGDTPVATPQPTPLVPEIQKVVPNTVTVDGGELITVTGRGFNTAGEELSIGGEKVEIISTSNTEMKFVMPPMNTGAYDLIYVYLGGSNLTLLRAITVIPKTITSADAADQDNSTYIPSNISKEMWQKPWRAKAIVYPFAPGKSNLTGLLRSMIRKQVRTYSRFATEVECVGFTMGPTVLRVDAALSLARAKAICDYIKVLRPRLEVNTIAGRQDRVVADRVRRVEVDFIRPDTRTTN